MLSFNELITLILGYFLGIMSVLVVFALKEDSILGASAIIMAMSSAILTYRMVKKPTKKNEAE